ncbi:voltage-gated potassium channel protein [Bordetella hinzii]|uniref:Voltage-gated potassium channel TrkA n=1 Tax=Bordetella hinzii TaxID=103855 RepID=A0AAN1RVJ3_9BORD|nr:voltage-gated potassium channel protein [Bordetella hinzii]AKQ58291.1 Voltage-gated potassium channel Kch [Bordetella hinzii]AZW16373.1 voltage-gated potassium channel TrkA [Bordetella hinzii]KCB34080.1 putative potassium channel protein [Bordetella hinzii CA90 BAL1384]KCB39734.1 putative potassium channel protein [Bordetella hinzii 5132]KCB43330.1 putative potassium channel protein [Bordetella hinzii 4161]
MPAKLSSLLARSVHLLLAIAVAFSGYLHLVSVFDHAGRPDFAFLSGFDTWRDAIDAVGLLDAPRALLGLGLVCMAPGLLLRARIAWAFSLLMLVLIGVLGFMGSAGHLLEIYNLLVFVLLLAAWPVFGRASLAAGSLFAVIAICSLLGYAIFGSLYLGREFGPPIEGMPAAVYFSVVTMSTVGFGDIVPHTNAARYFTLSIIILGITVFATSISAIAGPVIGGNVKRLIKGRIAHAMRHDHIILAGASSLAAAVYPVLREHGYPVTVIVPENVPHGYPEDADLIVGDATTSAVLLEAGAPKARYVLALRSDDAENAFIVLAAKDVGGPATKTVAVANTPEHLAKLRRVQPDIVFSLQQLVGELLARTLSGQKIDQDFVASLFTNDKRA